MKTPVYHEVHNQSLSLYKRISILIFLGFFTACTSAPRKFQADDLSQGITTAEGVGTISDNLIGKAKDEALKDAKRVAVQQVLGSLVSAKSQTVNYELVSYTITSKTEGFIENHEILSQEKASDTEYKVKIRAKVNTAKIEKTIEEVIANMGKPRMMAVVEEDYQGRKRSDSQSIAATEIESQFIAKGYPFVDKSTVEKLLKKNRKKIKDALGGNNSAVKELGVDAGAEFVLVGTSRIKSAGAVLEGSRMQSMQADLSIRVIDVNTGKILASEQVHGVFPHINPETGAVEAVKKAVVTLEKKVTDRVMKSWDPNKAQSISLLVIGLDYNDLRILRSELIEKVRGVKTVNPKGSVGKAAKLEVEFVGTSFELADRMLEANLSLKVKVGEVKPNSVDVQATK